MITPLGTLSLAALNPGASAAVAAGTGALDTSLTDLQARLAGFNTAAARLALSPPNPVQQLADLTALIGSFATIISAGIPAPSFQVAQVQAQVASLTALIADLLSQQSALLSLSSQLAVGGVAAYAYAGPCANLASELGQHTDGGFAGGQASSDSNALVLATTSPTAWAAMGDLYGV